MGNHTGREVELKLRVADMSALMKIAIASGGMPQPTAHQHNAFYDTRNGDMEQMQTLLRLRRESSKEHVHHFLTVKGRGTKTGMLSNVLEEEREITQQQAEQLRTSGVGIALLAQGPQPVSAYVQEILATVGERRLECLGSFMNERTRVPCTLQSALGSYAAELELDRTLFPGNQIHHEVELEVPPEVALDVAEAGFADLFARAGVEGRPSVGKARRFFIALRGGSLD